MPASLADRLLLRFDRWLHDRRVAALRKTFAACGAGGSIDLPVIIRGGEHLRLGARVSINAFTHIWAQGGLAIGDDTLVASHVAITTLTHDKTAAAYRDSLLTRPITIGANVWIGAHAVILPGVLIGDRAIIGAGAVVTHDVPAGTTVAGVPARALRSAAGAAP
jgi:acetyltransferase-like isoleucine patch superfamily enzyme